MDIHDNSALPIETLKHLRDSWVGRTESDNDVSSNSLEQLRHDVKTYLDRYFRQKLVCYYWIPLHEVVFFNQVSPLKQAFHPQLLPSIYTALAQPWTILKCHCCGPSDTFSPSSSSLLLPDICVLYTLYRECGRMINLYDWYIAFVSLTNPSLDDRQPTFKKRQKRCTSVPEVSSETSKSPMVINPMLQARFMRSISEFQILGLLKPTQRKPDHVLRLTWDS